MTTNSDLHPSAEQLAAFDGGRLPTAEREEVERHVAGCPACCHLLEALPDDAFAALVRAYAGKPKRPPSSVTPLVAPLDALCPGGEAVPPALVGHARYRVLEPIGSGGMGVVYKAVHQRLDRVVALKVIHPRLLARPELLEWFQREARAVARLRHPNIALAHDADQAGDLHFLVLEHVEGTSLDRVLAERGPLPVAEACDYLRQAALGLQHAHEHGLVHRDIKPANLLLTPQGQIKVVDFGLAHLGLGEQEKGAATSSSPLIGTPDYAAPEQARAPGDVDIRADVYGLGCTAYHLLTGQPPFPGGTALQKLLAHQERPPRPIAELRPGVPARLATVVHRMLAKAPGQRQATPGEVAAELANALGPGLLPGQPPSPGYLRHRLGQRWAQGLAAVVLLAGAVTAGVMAWPRPPGGGEPDTGASLVREGQAPETKPAPPPPAPGPSRPPLVASGLLDARQMARLKRQAADDALAWLRANNRWGSDAQIVAQTARTFDGALRKIDGFQINLGLRLVRSGKPVILAARHGALFRFELTAEQGRMLPVGETERVFYGYRKGGDLPRARARLRLFDLQIDRAGALPRGPRITGTVAYKVLEPIEDKVQVRLFYYPRPGNVRCIGIFHPREGLAAKEGKVTFDMPPVSKEVRREGLLVMFAEMTSERGADVIVESNTLAMLVRLRGRVNEKNADGR